MTQSTPIYLGIDTGGTFTDGVLLNPRTREVIRSVKVLTTHHDLKQCIAGVLEQLMPEDPSSLGLVSLSTTLATNAIAEGKRKPVALLLFGYDPDLVNVFHFERQFGTPHYYFLQGKHGVDGVEEKALDEAEIVRVVESVKKDVDAFAVAAFSGARNAEHEERAAEIIASLTHLPVVQANHLSSELDSIRRATTASLNASLLTHSQDFLDAVQLMLEKHGVSCPIMMVRGDGSVVKADYARRRPVEIIHSGPATSTIGGQFLAGVQTGVVIDVGGTTTDIALVDEGRMEVLENAATVGPYRTCVKTIRVRSFGLGGDSQIRFDRARSLSVGPERVLPFAHFGSEFPEAKQELLEWLSQKDIHYHDRMEVWILRREPQHPFEDVRTQKALQLLRTGPQILPRLLKQVKAVSAVQVNVQDLVNQEIIERVGLTPTDLLHVTGEFSPWDVEMARAALAAVVKNFGETEVEFITRVRNTMTDRIAAEVIQFLSRKKLSEPAYSEKRNDLDRWLFSESLYPRNAHLGSRIFLKDPIIGIGAPAEALLPPVAKALGTNILLPKYFEVANAVGTVVGNVMVRQSGEVAPLLNGSAITGYIARTGSVQRTFDEFADALTYAHAQLVENVATEAAAAGAEDPSVEIEVHETIQGMMATLSAWTLSKPGMNGKAHS